MIEADSTDPTFPSYLSNGVEKFLTVFNGADAVLNVAIGWEHQINNKMIVHLGMRSDFSYAHWWHWEARVFSCIFAEGTTNVSSA